MQNKSIDIATRKQYFSNTKAIIQQHGSNAPVTRKRYSCNTKAILKRPVGPASYQPRAAPWVIWHKRNHALKGQKLLHLQREKPFEHTKPRALPWAICLLSFLSPLRSVIEPTGRFQNVVGKESGRAERRPLLCLIISPPPLH